LLSREEPEPDDSETLDTIDCNVLADREPEPEPEPDSERE